MKGWVVIWLAFVRGGRSFLEGPEAAVAFSGRMGYKCPREAPCLRPKSTYLASSSSRLELAQRAVLFPSVTTREINEPVIELV